MIRGRVALLLMLLAVLVLDIGVRIFGPGDLYDKDQPKTMACTADVVLNGRWIWPRDMLLEPSTKPPLYNWLDALVLMAAPRWHEWTFKVPSLLAFAVLLWLCFAMARSMLRDETVALLAAAIWVANGPAMKIAYLSRPDMLLAAFLVAAWMAATAAMSPNAPRPTRWAVVFWLCTAGAALTKGPPALLASIYVPLAAKLIYGRWRIAGRLGWAWGLPLLLAIAGAWVCLAERRHPGVLTMLIRSEATSRIFAGGPEGLAKPFWYMPMWFVSKFMPWSLAAIAALALIGPTKWFRHPLSPAILWVGLVITFFGLSAGKRFDYLLPAYPAAAILAAWAIVETMRRVRVPQTMATAAIMVVVINIAARLAWHELRHSPEARRNDTGSVITFARQVEAIVPRDQRLVCLVKGYHPLLTLLHRHAGNRARPEDLTPGTWVIAPRVMNWQERVLSERLPDVLQTGPGLIAPGKVALYRVGDPHVKARVLIQILAEQQAWDFPPDRYRASRDDSQPR